MWIDRTTYDDLRLELAKLQAVCGEQARANTALQSGFDWLRVRVTQLEMERAQLIENYMGIKINVPQMVSAPVAERKDKEGAAALAAAVAPYFTDMGDDEALKQGVGWDDEGQVTFAKKKS